MPWIAPNTILEKGFSSIIVMVGAIFFASLLGSIVTAINAVERSNAQRRDKITLMHNFVSTRRLNSTLKRGMTNYVDAMFQFNSLVEGTDRLGTLPKAIKGELLGIIHREMLENCELLRVTSRGTALMVCQQMHPQVCLAESVLVEQGSVATHLFLLHRGHLQIHLADNER